MNANRDGRTRRERGAAILEMALVSVVLFALLFGIITYAWMMSFRQSMTQAAAEGARAGAVALASADNSIAEGDADAAMQAAVNEFHDCSGAMTCDAVVADCPAPSVKQCVFVDISYDYDADPLLPRFPGLGLLLPDSLSASSVAEISVEP